MVLAILVETTSPIRVLRRPGVFAVLVAAVVSAMAYFFSVAAFLLAAFFAVTVFFTGLLALAAAPLPPASSFWRNTVCHARRTAPTPGLRGGTYAGTESGNHAGRAAQHCAQRGQSSTRERPKKPDK